MPFVPPPAETARRAAPRVHARLRIGGARINALDADEAVCRILADAVADRGGTAIPLTLDHLARIPGDPALAAALEGASHVTAGASALARLGRRAGLPVSRAGGGDLLLPLARAAGMTRVPVHLVGERADRLEAAADRLVETAPRLAVVGIAVLAPGADPAGEEARALARRVEASRARLCLIGLASPAQELFAAAAAQEAPGVVFACTGRALERLASPGARLPGRLARTGLDRLRRIVADPLGSALPLVHAAACMVGLGFSVEMVAPLAPPPAPGG